MAAGTCVFCGERIDPDRDYRKVIGWERHRDQGGTNALRLREPQDDWACRFCIDRQARGLSAGQQALV